jgi:hypothetical protein
MYGCRKEEEARKWNKEGIGRSLIEAPTPICMDGLRKTTEDLKICWVADEIRTDNLLNQKY